MLQLYRVSDNLMRASTSVQQRKKNDTNDNILCKVIIQNVQDHYI